MKTSFRWTQFVCRLVLLALLAGCAVPTPFAPTLPVEPPAHISTSDAQPVPPGPIPAYLDREYPIQERVESLLGLMTLAEKIGQMTQVEKNSILPKDVATYFIGSVLSGGGGSPRPNTPEAWADMVDSYQEQALNTRLRIPILYGVDAVHGHNNLYGAVIFPHNVGLGAADDPTLMEQIGQATAEEMAATGIRWNFAPVLAVPQDIRWGRAYEGYGENTELVTRLGVAYQRGLQGEDLRQPSAAIATAKHYIGDGGTEWGTSTTGSYMIDQGDMQVDEATLRALYLPPYEAAIEAGARSVMVSFSSWNEEKMHGHHQLVTELLKGELGFDGFVVSDWKGIDQLPGDYYDDVVTSINAGLDMIMVPYDYKTFISTLSQAVERGDVSEDRINDAVRRILTVKFELGLFENPYTDRDLLAAVGSDEHRVLAREAVAKSLVLLQNENSALPIAKDTATIFVGGRGADDIGMQCGGWTIEWQGKMDDITPGTTILEGIAAEIDKSTTLVYHPRGEFIDAEGLADVGIAVVGELPYAEGEGDRADLSLSTFDQALIQRMRERSKVLVVVILSGRPMIITDLLPKADAWVAAWLPGTEGAGVTDVLFGDVPFTGKLPYTWPHSMDQLPLGNMLENAESDPPLFPFGFGMTAP